MLKCLLLVATSVLLVQSALYTSSHWKDNVKDGVLPDESAYAVQVDTICNTVTLNKDGYDYNGTVKSGYLRVGKNNSVLGFIFYGKEHTAESDLPKVPILIWLNGGPGSSSQLGNFFELGPFWFKQESFAALKVVRNANAWTKDYSILFVDQPVGTGISYADPSASNVYCKSMAEVANDFYIALEQLYMDSKGCFKQLKILPSQPLFIFGESYAGKYAPAIASKILEKAKTGFYLTGLRGVGIGDGFTHPFETLSMMGEYAYNLGLIDYQERSKAEQYILNASYQYGGKAWGDLHQSFENVLGLVVAGTGGVNFYDITKYAQYPTNLLDIYLGNSDTIALYKLNSQIEFNKQSRHVYETMYEDFMKDYVGLVEDLINQQLQVIIYTGQNDLIANTPGTFRWVERLHFAEAEAFRNTLFSVWKVAGKVAGYRKETKNLELRTFNNAGHLVSMDQGVAALQMVNEFVSKALKL